MCLLQVSKLLEKTETGSVIIPTRNNSKNSDKNFYQCQTMKPEESMPIREHRLIQNTKLKRLKYLP